MSNQSPSRKKSNNSDFETEIGEWVRRVSYRDMDDDQGSLIRAWSSRLVQSGHNVGRQAEKALGSAALALARLRTWKAPPYEFVARKAGRRCHVG